MEDVLVTGGAGFIGSHLFVFSFSDGKNQSIFISVSPNIL